MSAKVLMHPTLLDRLIAEKEQEVTYYRQALHDLGGLPGVTATILPEEWRLGLRPCDGDEAIGEAADALGCAEQELAMLRKQAGEQRCPDCHALPGRSCEKGCPARAETMQDLTGGNSGG